VISVACLHIDPVALDLHFDAAILAVILLVIWVIPKGVSGSLVLESPLHTDLDFVLIHIGPATSIARHFTHLLLSVGAGRNRKPASIDRVNRDLGAGQT